MLSFEFKIDCVFVCRKTCNNEYCSNCALFWTAAKYCYDEIQDIIKI